MASTDRHSAVPRLDPVDTALRPRALRAMPAFGCALVALDGRFLRADQEVCELLGRTPSELRALSLASLIHPQDRAADQESVERLRRGELTRSDLSLRCFRQDGTIAYVALHRKLRRDGRGRPVHFVLVLQEDTERVQRQSQRAFHRGDIEPAGTEGFVSGLAAAVVVVDRAGGLHANPRALELFGRSLAEEGVDHLAGRFLDLDGHELASEQLPWARAFRGERLTAEEYSVLRADGSRMRVTCSVGTMDGVGLALEGAFCVFEDVTALEVRERARADWTALVAHDLSQPASAIRIYAKRLGERAGDCPDREKMFAAIARLERMITSLRDATGLDTAKLDLRLATVDLCSVVEGVVARFNDEPGVQPVRLIRFGEIPSVVADVSRTEQVLENLIGNARKYSVRDSEIVVKLRARSERVEVDVVNEGDGIAPHEIPFVFDRYRRSPRARASGIPGLGLGLYIARALVEAQGGHLDVESVPGVVTTFRFDLPRADGDEA